VDRAKDCQCAEGVGDAQNIKDGPKRVEAAKKAAAKAGITIKETLWPQGEDDFLSIGEGRTNMRPPPSTSTSLNKANIHTHTTRAFTAEEMTKILARVD
jgi:uncharacterized protein with GYD domain